MILSESELRSLGPMQSIDFVDGAHRRLNSYFMHINRRFGPNSAHFPLSLFSS